MPTRHMHDQYFQYCSWTRECTCLLFGLQRFVHVFYISGLPMGQLVQICGSALFSSCRAYSCKRRRTLHPPKLGSPFYLSMETLNCMAVVGDPKVRLNPAQSHGTRRLRQLFHPEQFPLPRQIKMHYIFGDNTSTAGRQHDAKGTQAAGMLGNMLQIQR